MEPSRVLADPSLSVFMCYSHLGLSSFERSQAHLCRIAMSELFVFVRIYLVIAARNNIYYSNTADPRLLLSIWGVIAPLLSHLYGCLENLDFFEILFGTPSHLFQIHFTFRGSEETDWSAVDRGNPFPRTL